MDKNAVWRLVSGVEGPANAEEMEESQSSLLEKLTSVLLGMMSH